MGSRELVASYFTACSRGDVESILGHFHDDAVIYDTNHPPVRGAARIGEFYAQVAKRWAGAVWHVDTFVDGGSDHCASEWSMWAPSARAVVRGSEHYEIRDGLIAEIRQYWTYRRESPGTGLQGLDYDADPRFWTPAREEEEDA